MTTAPYQAAIVGCGDVWRNHAAAISRLPQIELVGLVEPDPIRSAAAHQLYPVPVYQSVDDLLSAVDVDVVHICTPHDQHLPVAAAALQAGVHVICEKLLAHELDRAAQLADIAALSGARLAVCYQNRYNKTSQEAKRALDAGEIGRPIGCFAEMVWTREAPYYHARPWRGQYRHSGGGVLINQAIHTLDLLVWLLGPVRDIRGNASQRKFMSITDVEDTAEAVFTHDSGLQTCFYATLASPVQRPVQIEIIGDEGSMTLCEGLVIHHADGTTRSVDEIQVSTPGRSYWGVSHELLIDDFYQRIDDTEPFWIGADHAMESLRIVKEIQRLSGMGVSRA